MAARATGAAIAADVGAEAAVPVTAGAAGIPAMAAGVRAGAADAAGIAVVGARPGTIAQPAGDPHAGGHMVVAAGADGEGLMPPPLSPQKQLKRHHSLLVSPVARPTVSRRSAVRTRLEMIAVAFFQPSLLFFVQASRSPAFKQPRDQRFHCISRQL